MILRLAIVGLAMSAGALLLAAGTPGTFVGTIADLSQEAGEGETWMYVEGRNGWIRRVETSAARVLYNRSIPAQRRLTDPSDALAMGVQVRVTALQDSKGEWRAQRIEILRLPRPGRQAAGRR